MAMDQLADLYRNRFQPQDLPAKAAIWKVLCRDFFQRFVGQGDRVLDLACGYGEFINHIQAAHRVGIDLNPDSRGFLAPDVEFHAVSAAEVAGLGLQPVDMVFASNFLEHLPDKATLSRVMAQVFAVLKPGGRFVVMGPNIRYVPGAYWDFLDHHLPLTNLSVGEGLALAGFEVVTDIDRFLPYTTKSKLPQHPALVSLYLKVPLVWRFLGSQFLVVGKKPL
jgi:SAM-dependent methyltransferase